MLARGHRFARMVALAAGAALSITLLVPAATGGASPPPNPSDQQINNAQHTKDALAGQVGSLSSQIADLQSRIARLHSNVEFAEQKVALAIQRLQQAEAATAAAKQHLQTAQNNVVTAQQSFDQFARDSYMSDQVDGLAGGLLTASDPSELLQRNDYLQFATSNRLTAIDNLSRATVEQSNARAAAQLAQNKQQAAKNAADQAMRAAQQALQQAKTLQGQLNSQLASKQAALNSAKSTLATLNNQRAAYNAWVAEQARIARERAEAAARAAAAAAAARARAAAAAQSQQSNGWAGSSVVAPSGGGWTQAKGNAAVARAMNYLGMPYAWAGGNASGPTYGVCGPDGAWNDCHVYGFDCSGLVMYAWGINWAHFAATQYSQAGSFHPSVSQLLPGDLVFWSDDGTQWGTNGGDGIGHVAIYIGNGNVIQAPQSGDVIKITPLGQVEPGYFGATRPLT